MKQYLQNALELTKILEPEEDDKSNTAEEIIIESDNKSEIFKADLNSLILIKSANNYIEVFWQKDDKVHKKLIRNTMRSIENQLKSYPSFIRCHRTSLVNKNFIEKKVSGSKGLQIKLKGIDKLVPVSRQYSLKIKEQTSI